MKERIHWFSVGGITEYVIPPVLIYWEFLLFLNTGFLSKIIKKKDIKKELKCVNVVDKWIYLIVILLLDI